MRSRLLPAVALAASLVVGAVAGCGGPETPPGSTPVPPSGISGKVVLGPTCPVEVEGEPPCVTPYAALLLVLDTAGNVAGRATSADDGTFRLDLPPGDYVVTPQSGDPFPVAQPINVTVVAGEYTELEINYDTGIR
ncbi:MAG TPA: carboxypeptidase-like regulatory domain-containing protein [Candidatus Limnocylindria bacterium]|nr:carboxypeptidase-like regulatory domain-containing protein [Candidatus Limnocylindria bacterium]